MDAERRAKLLLVDDDAEFGSLTARRLQRLGFDVDFHHGAFGAAVIAGRGDYDLILLDVDMPGLSGPGLLEVVRRISSSAALRVVFFSSGDGLAELAQKHGANGYLSKSASQADLLNGIKAALT
jgi:DNA-binding response OmpR family regulator